MATRGVIMTVEDHGIPNSTDGDVYDQALTVLKDRPPFNNMTYHEARQQLRGAVHAYGWDETAEVEEILGIFGVFDREMEIAHYPNF